MTTAERRSLRRSFLFSCALLAALPAAADPLSDLRTILGRYPAAVPFRASASLHVNGESQDAGGSRGGSTNFDVQFSSNGMLLHVPPADLGAAANEAEGKKRNPESLTPTRTAMVALTLFDIIDALDIATMLLNDLDGASLIQSAQSSYSGKPATLLRIKVKSTLAGTGSRLVNEPKIELRVWIIDGVPVAAERDSNFSASFLFIRAANTRKERWEIATAGDRLYASRNDRSNAASAVGKSVASSFSVTYSPK